MGGLFFYFLLPTMKIIPMRVPQLTTPASLTRKQVMGVLELMAATWPPKEVNPKSVEEKVDDYYAKNDEKEVIIVMDGSKVIGYAAIFPREVNTPNGSLTVMALANVCVIADWQNKGLGKAIVKRAFEQLGQGKYWVSLFQTGVPEFYEKLGGKRVHNVFVNRKQSVDPLKNPWSDDHVMTYPEGFPWPEGEIDLNGPGY